MEDLDPKLLRAFLHAAGEGSFAAAARRMDLSPGTVALRVRTLEKRLGARLFRRSSRGLVLAPRGSRLLPAARDIVEINDRLFERAASISASGSAGFPLPAAPASARPDS